MMYKKIDIDFDVFKKLTVMRDGPDMTENDVIRKLLDLPPSQSLNPGSIQRCQEKAWSWKGISLPEGAELKAEYKGQQYIAKIREGAIRYDNRNYTTPSAVATAVTNTQVSGWRFWEYKISETEDWKPLNDLRKK